MSEASLVVRYTDISLNSELDVIYKLNEVAAKMKKRHQIILMVDLGDLREGIYYDQFDLSDVGKKYTKLSHVDLIGIGTNLTCYGSVIPTIETYRKLKEIKDQIESHFKIKTRNHFRWKLIFNSNAFSFWELPKFINNLRIGEAMIQKLTYLYEDKNKF